jgi:tRNA threonylcarbamoyladenosine modification (KEOPS) complex Cgi121 subunit
VSHVIAGARGDIADPEATLRQVREWAKARQAEVLVADARAVFGRDHLESAVRHTERAKTEGRMGARSLDIETLLYLVGQRQVVDAIRVAGLRNGTRTIAVVLWTSEDVDGLLRALRWSRDDGVLEARGKSLEVLGVNELERETVGEAAAADLALEKVALLDVLK